MTKLEKTIEEAVTATDAKVRSSLVRVRERAQTRVRDLVRLLDRHPAAGLATAFVGGWLLARLLQKLD